MTNPATDYVAEFTREIPRAKVLSARSVMKPPDGASCSGEVAADTRIEMLAARVLDADAPLAVVDAGGTVIGRLDRETVLEVLVRRETPP